jgi:hypothetical protein
MPQFRRERDGILKDSEKDEIHIGVITRLRTDAKFINIDDLIFWLTRNESTEANPIKKQLYYDIREAIEKLKY